MTVTLAWLKNRAKGEHCYHKKPAAALPVPEISRGPGAALRPPYRGGRWFESTASHHASNFKHAKCTFGQTCASMRARPGVRSPLQP